MYDIIIIGAGPGGLTAAIYARRANRSVLVLEKESFGGQITYSPKVENIPGFTALSGNEFAAQRRNPWKPTMTGYAPSQNPSANGLSMNVLGCAAVQQT